MEDATAQLLGLIDDKIKEAGSDDPFEVADCNVIVHDFCYGTIIGVATHYGSIGAFSVNKKLERTRMCHFAGWHELGHIFGEDVFTPGFEWHRDNEIFAHDVDSKLISWQEKRANLVAANVVVKDDDVYEVTNWDSEAMRSYRRLKAYQRKLADAFNQMRFVHKPDTTYGKTKMNDLKRQLREVHDSIEEIECDVMQCNHYKTKREMAAALDINERILNYKFEAMRIRGLDIDRQELERYDRMFKEVI